MNKFEQNVISLLLALILFTTGLIGAIWYNTECTKNDNGSYDCSVEVGGE